MTDLKHCPFCGAEYGSYGLVHDDGCYISRLVRILDEEDDTAYEGLSDAWNTRAECTCQVEFYDDGWDALEEIEYADPQWELSCGHTVYGTMQPAFCSTCGARVVE